MARVLVVDDDADIRFVMRAVLEDAGHEVLEASDGAAALVLLRQSPESLVVVLDLRMPRVDGVAVLRRVPIEGECLRRHAYVASTASTPIHPSVHPFLEAVGARVLPRPFDIGELSELVAEAARCLATVPATSADALPVVGADVPNAVSNFVLPRAPGVAAFRVVPEMVLEVMPEVVLEVMPEVESLRVGWSDMLLPWEYTPVLVGKSYDTIRRTRALLAVTRLRMSRPLRLRPREGAA